MMNHLFRLVITLLVVAFAAVGPVALASGGGGDAHDDGHHDPCHYAGEYVWTDDCDSDGTANWMDPTNFDEPNTHYVVKGLLFHAINFVLLYGLLFVVLRKPVGDLLRDRALGIKNELEDSAEARDLAKTKYESLVARLGDIEGEVASMQTDAKKAAVAEEAKLIEMAEAEAVRIGETATRSIRDEVSRARNELRKDAVELGVKLAESILTGEIQAGDHRRLARQFLDTVEGEGVNGHV